VLVLAAAQWMAMALRQVALLAVAATLPLAAAGSLTATTRGWLSRLTPWAVAMVIYKPAAALVHAVGQQYLSQLAEPGGSGVGTVLAGVVVLALGVVALPLSLRLLSWSSVRIAAGGISADAMAGARGAVRLSSPGHGSPAVRLASFMEHAGPGSQRLITGARPAHRAGAPADSGARRAHLAGPGASRPHTGALPACADTGCPAKGSRR
jgi:type IV secretion system protein TrbL